MGKKGKTKEKDSKQQRAPREAVKAPQKVESEANDNPHDFGGIPNRDLKKNLGCG